MTPTMRLVREPRGPLHAHGTVTWRVHVGATWVGWVGDEQHWTGSRFTGRRWWACWRQDGDRYARDNTDQLPTRRAALAWLITQTSIPDREETTTH